MPFAIPFLLLLTGAGAGAFVGAQIDDKIDTPAADTNAQSISPLKLALYAGVGIGAMYAAKKAGLLKLGG